MGILHRCLELQLLHLQFAKALFVTKKHQTRMWANAQRDGRPAV